MFDRATITLGNGPHSSYNVMYWQLSDSRPMMFIITLTSRLQAIAVCKNSLSMRYKNIP